jgi:hypothetical protein
MRSARTDASRTRLLAAAACAVAVVFCGACGGGNDKVSEAPSLKRFPRPLFDGLWLGMTRDAAANAHPIRPSLTASGRNRLVWFYDRPGEYTVELTFPENRHDAKLARIDVHFGANRAASERTVAILSRSLGDPEASHRKASTNAYGDHLHDQYDTIWSDAEQYVFMTERVPVEGRSGRPDYFITVKRKELLPTGPPTGYVPPPPPKGKDGKPVEEPAF